MKLAMIPCAGFGRRMLSLTTNRPKPLLPIQNVPLLGYTLFLLHQWQITDCVINLHYLGGQIKSYLSRFPYFRIHFSDETDQILGTAGGIRQAIETTPLEGQFLFINPDTIFWPDTPPQVATDSTELYLDLCKKTDGNTERGFRIANRPGDDSITPINNLGNNYTAVEISTETKTSIAHNQPFQYFYSGLSVLHTDVFASIKPGQVAELRDVFYDCARQHQLNGRLYRGIRHDCGSYDDYQKLKMVDPVPIGIKDRWSAFLSGWSDATVLP